MNMNQVYGVILAGGTGQRLWPKSRGNLPKYALSLGKGHSLIQEAFDRIRAVVSTDRIRVVTEQTQVGLIRRQLPMLKAKNVIVEPFGRNTAAAIGLAAVYINKEVPDGIMAVFPADHLIRDMKNFKSAIKAAVNITAKTETLVTLGIRPSFAATGFGYIRTEDRNQKTENREQIADSRRGIYKVARFVEKPDRLRANRFLKSGKYLWNSGIFIWKVSAIRAALRDHMPELYSGLEEVKKLIGKRGYKGHLVKLYRRLDSISIDYGILEKAKGLGVVKAGFEWDDLGTWASLARIYRGDKQGNIVRGNFKGIDSTNSIIIGEAEHLIGAVGIDGLVLVHTPQATLVCDKKRAEQVRDLVGVLASEKGLKRYL